MKKHLHTIVSLALTFLVLSVFVGIIPAHALPAHSLQVVASDSKGDACNGLSQLGGTTCGGGETEIGKIVSAVVNIISYFAGIIAIIMIVVSGIRFVASGGDANKVSGAKTALVYALIGIAVAATAQALVHFVLNRSDV